MTAKNTKVRENACSTFAPFAGKKALVPLLIGLWAFVPMFKFFRLWGLRK
jgi:hypothetical protein